jgi:hypothetical protein
VSGAVDFCLRAVSSSSIFPSSFDLPARPVDNMFFSRRAAPCWCNGSLHQRQIGSTVVRGKGTQLGRRYLAQSSLQNGDAVQPKIGRLVLVRHGQSEWNVTDPRRGLTARFVSYCLFFIYIYIIHSAKLKHYVLLTETRYIHIRRDGQI